MLIHFVFKGRKVNFFESIHHGAQTFSLHKWHFYALLLKPPFLRHNYGIVIYQENNETKFVWSKSCWKWNGMTMRPFPPPLHAVLPREICGGLAHSETLACRIMKKNRDCPGYLWSVEGNSCSHTPNNNICASTIDDNYIVKRPNDAPILRKTIFKSWKSL